MTMPAGRYYVGDLCYVLHDEWDEVCELFFKDRTDHGCNEGEFTLKDGRKFACLNTAYGDGTYCDQRGRSYSVDAGSIGCILLSDLELMDTGNFISGGQVLEFPSDFDVGSAKGVLYFGSVAIDTDPPYEVEEDEYEDE